MPNMPPKFIESHMIYNTYLWFRIALMSIILMANAVHFVCERYYWNFFTGQKMVTIENDRSGSEYKKKKKSTPNSRVKFNKWIITTGMIALTVTMDVWEFY